MSNFQHTLNRLIADKAVIYQGEFSDIYAAYPNGDRRRRAVCWLDTAQFKKLRAEGILELRAGGYHIAYSYLRRHKAGVAGKGHAAQHRDYVERDVFIPEGSKRKAVFNNRTSPLRRLSRMKDMSGDSFLTNAEIEAGERFASDYHFSALESVTTQNYMATNMGGHNDGGYEDMSIKRLDARNRVMTILNELDAGLDKAVIAVCVNELTVERLEQTENWVKKSGQMILKLGLQRLVKFYGTQAGQRT